jgi:hypothetical protein
MLVSVSIIKADGRESEGNLPHVLKERLKRRARISDRPDFAHAHSRKRNLCECAARIRRRR